MSRWKALFLIAVLLGNLLSLTQTRPALARPGIHTYPVRLSFNQRAADGESWQGSVWGDLNGTLNGELLSLHHKTQSWQVELEWSVEAVDPAYSFTAHLQGTVNPRTKYINLMGSVTDGWLTGAAIEVNGKVSNLRMLDLKGTMFIMPVLALGEASNMSAA